MDIQNIVGTARSVSQLLSNTRYGLDFYQREYKWADAHVTELLDDLADRFLDEYDSSHDRSQVASYRPYFLGPIVTTERDGIHYLVDGQQRITTLTLILICLRRWLDDLYPDDANALRSLICSFKMGKTTFNVDVPERTACLQAILDNKDFSTENKNESVSNLWERYLTIVERFPDDLRGEDGSTLPYFSDWLQHRVTLVHINVPDQDMALEIFETMNDRGLRLTNIDMLKGFLVARVGEDSIIHDLNESWRRHVTALTEVQDNADAEFVKAWLRGNYAATIRPRKAKASPGDFDIIGTAFHKWVRDNPESLGLIKKEDYRRFVADECFPLSKRYIQLLQYSSKLEGGMEALRYNAWSGLTLQLPVVLAAIAPEDDEEIFRKKVAMIAGALEIYVVRRMVNYRNFGYSTIVVSMFNLMKRLRNRPTNEVQGVLSEWLESEDDRLDGILWLRLHGRKYSHVKYVLARISSWLDTELNTGISIEEYMNRKRNPPFEVEHIWANKYNRHKCEFESEHEFAEHRNKIGGLLLLPKPFNASYGDLPYEDKVGHYLSQNPLAQSLNPDTYEHNPTFRRLRDKHKLAFKPYDAFTRADIDERQQLFLDIAKIIWNPENIGLNATV
ncbi:MAG: DUF262 domain-containing protein [Acidimicrobiia bacterium]|nr:DUF262 domain-containing protein [Acidimicrobiia bacterium]